MNKENITLDLIEEIFKSYNRYEKNPKNMAYTELINRLFHLIELILVYLKQIQKTKRDDIE